MNLLVLPPRWEGRRASLSELVSSPSRTAFPAPTAARIPCNPQCSSHSRPTWQPLFLLSLPSPFPTSPSSSHTSAPSLAPGAPAKAGPAVLLTPVSPEPSPGLIQHPVLRNPELLGWTDQVTEPRHRLTTHLTPSASGQQTRSQHKVHLWPPPPPQDPPSN